MGLSNTGQESQVRAGWFRLWHLKGRKGERGKEIGESNDREKGEGVFRASSAIYPGFPLDIKPSYVLRSIYLCPPFSDSLGVLGSWNGDRISASYLDGSGRDKLTFIIIPFLAIFLLFFFSSDFLWLFLSLSHNYSLATSLDGHLDSHPSIQTNQIKPYQTQYFRLGSIVIFILFSFIRIPIYLPDLLASLYCLPSALLPIRIHLEVPFYVMYLFFHHNLSI